MTWYNLPDRENIFPDGLKACSWLHAISSTLFGVERLLEAESFEREFADYVGTSCAIGVASSTDAIRLGLCALGIWIGDEVITVSHTAVATFAVIEQCGATPVLVDINPHTFTMYVDKMQRAINSKTRAIIPVHLYGHPANMDLILQVANQHGVEVLEDCAQSHGASYQGKRVGSWEVSCRF